MIEPKFETAHSMTGHDPEQTVSPLPAALCSRNPFAWLTFFGPGAVIASLTIGSGELIFSSRAGALFGYRLLWFFLLVLVLKWILAFSTARHMILTGAHPFQRWMDLPGPRGWFPMVFGLMALVCFPVWVSFHAGTLGTLLSWLAGTDQWLRGGAYFVWGMAVLVVVLVLVAAGGYATLERIQLIIIAIMLLSVVVSLILLNPDWFELFKGLLIPRTARYPEWIGENREVAARPIWVETITYVGVLGGSGYDYLAYVGYLRAKHWGRAGRALADRATLEEMATHPGHVTRRWLRALWIDSVLSFLAVLIFAGVFVACGAIVLRPQHQVPGGTNLLRLQAGFINPAYPWLQPLYFVGAFLAIFGTLYGTIEVAPVVLREWVEAFRPGSAKKYASSVRFWSVLWTGLGGLAVLVWAFNNYLASGAENPPGLIALLTPVNLFTGVLACGFICSLSLWTDHCHLPHRLRMTWPLTCLNSVAAAIFVWLGLKAYWDYRGWTALAVLAGILTAGLLIVRLKKLRQL
jgi:hypothetical protein